MYKLECSYGKKAFDEWYARKLRDLRPAQTTPDVANTNIWHVTSFRQLLEAAAFLGSMNKRLALFYRGQSIGRNPVPALCRDTWTIFDDGRQLQIDSASRPRLWRALVDVGQHVFEICDGADLGLPRWRGLRDIREVQWAVIQHYGLWPTPLLDVTRNLRVAASFAMGFVGASASSPKIGYVYVAGLPQSTGSIAYDIDQHVVLANLHSACPPIARRPHYQDGFLLGRFPLYEVDDALLAKSSLLRRLVAKFELHDSGTFWDIDFPPIGTTALLPSQDPLRDRFTEEFGKTARFSVSRLANSICT